MHTPILAAMLLLAAPAGGGDPKAELTAEQQATYRAAFERVLAADVEAEWKAIAARKHSGAKPACAENGVCHLDCDCAPAGELLAYHLKKEPAAWAVVGPLAAKGFAREETRERAVDLLAWARGDEYSQALAERLFANDATAFSRDQVLAFAEAGSEPLAAEAAKRAKSDVRCAAFAAMQGDRGFAPVLEKAAKQRLASDQALLDAYVAAAALRKLGDEEHWNRLTERVHNGVVGALDDGAIERARDLALGAEFCVHGLSAGKGYGLCYLDSRLAFHRSVRSGDLAEADQIFELIEKLEVR